MMIQQQIAACLDLHRNRWLYFALLTLIGGLGSWITGVQHLHDSQKTTGYAFCASLGTFSISLAVMSLAELWVLKQNPEMQSAYDLTRGLAVLFFGVVSAICGVVSLFELQLWSVVACWMSFGLAALAWWVTHLADSALDKSDPISVIGGPV